LATDDVADEVMDDATPSPSTALHNLVSPSVNSAPFHIPSDRPSPYSSNESITTTPPAVASAEVEVATGQERSAHLTTLPVSQKAKVTLRATDRRELCQIREASPITTLETLASRFGINFYTAAKIWSEKDIWLKYTEAGECDETGPELVIKDDEMAMDSVDLSMALDIVTPAVFEEEKEELSHSIGKEGINLASTPDGFSAFVTHLTAASDSLAHLQSTFVLMEQAEPQTAEGNDDSAVVQRNRMMRDHVAGLTSSLVAMIKLKQQIKEEEVESRKREEKRRGKLRATSPEAGLTFKTNVVERVDEVVLPTIMDEPHGESSAFTRLRSVSPIIASTSASSSAYPTASTSVSRDPSSFSIIPSCSLPPPSSSRKMISIGTQSDPLPLSLPPQPSSSLNISSTTVTTTPPSPPLVQLKMAIIEPVYSDKFKSDHHVSNNQLLETFLYSSLNHKSCQEMINLRQILMNIVLRRRKVPIDQKGEGGGQGQYSSPSFYGR
jgi:hypothetical protein